MFIVGKVPEKADPLVDSVGTDTLSFPEFNGWERIYYEICKEEIRTKGNLGEDQRSADWKYLLPLKSGWHALVLNSNWGAIPVSLAQSCDMVCAVSYNLEKAHLLCMRKQQQGLRNIFPVCVVGVDWNLPFREDSFDVVYANNLGFETKNRNRFLSQIRQVRGLLKRGGFICLSQPNRLSFQSMIGRWSMNFTTTGHSLAGYKRLLKRTGFKNVMFYGPVPTHDSIPLFYLPLNGHSEIKFFFHSIFPLVETVSPEVKAHYGLQYRIGKATVKIAQLLNMTFVAKYFLPGYLIIAQKRN